MLLLRRFLETVRRITCYAYSLDLWVKQVLMQCHLHLLIGMAAWLYIIYEVFSGEGAGKLNASSGNASCTTSI